MKPYQRRIDPSLFVDETWAILRQAQAQYGAAARMELAEQVFAIRSFGSSS